MSVGGMLVYRCRKCKARYANCHAPNLHTALICIVDGYEFPKKWGGMLPKMTDIHTCSKGVFGIGDLIGGEEDL